MAARERSPGRSRSVDALEGARGPGDLIIAILSKALCLQADVAKTVSGVSGASRVVVRCDSLVAETVLAVKLALSELAISAFHGSQNAASVQHTRIWMAPYLWYI